MDIGICAPNGFNPPWILSPPYLEVMPFDFSKSLITNSFIINKTSEKPLIITRYKVRGFREFLQYHKNGIFKPLHQPNAL
jgi:hypothetical protein